MRIRLFVKFEVKPQHIDTFIEHMQIAKSELIKVSGCESVELIQCADTPTKVFLSEIWESQEIHDRYAAKMAESASMGDLALLLDGAPEPAVFYLK